MTGPGSVIRHVPVLLPEVVGALVPVDGEIYIDGTFGAGGYTSAVLEAARCKVIAIDRDPGAIAAGQALVARYQDRLSLVHGRFADMAEIAADAGAPLVDGVMLDIGISSMQIDEAERGFSFQSDGPLDMRMSGEGLSAADVVNTMEESDLADILFHLGDERRSRAIARAIVRQRGEAPFARTLELAELAAKVLGHKKSDPKHPATRTFQALRIYVNDELGQLGEALSAAEACLKPGGRLAVVTFHSLEDRIVKQFFAARTGNLPLGSRHLPATQAVEVPPSFQFVNRRPVSPGVAETNANPRARSAKLRSAVRTVAAAWPAGDVVPRVPRL